MPSRRCKIDINLFLKKKNCKYLSSHQMGNHVFNPHGTFASAGELARCHLWEDEEPIWPDGPRSTDIADVWHMTRIVT